MNSRLVKDKENDGRLLRKGQGSMKKVLVEDEKAENK